MSLVLRLMNSGTLPNGQTAIRMVDGALTIGRGEENDLALPDPDRLLSKRHCVLEERNGDYVVIDISTNGTFLNYGAERIGNIPAPLNHGDVIKLGSFELVVEIDTGVADPLAAHPLPPAHDSLIVPDRSREDFTASGLDDPLDNGAEPWDAILDDPLAAPVPSRDRAAMESPALPEDPFAVSPSSADPFFDDVPLAPSGGASAPDHRPAEQDHFSTPSIQSPMIPDDWDDLLSSDRPQGPASSPAPRCDPRAAPPSAPQHAPAPQSVPERDAAETAARAFLAAAGAEHVSIPPAELAETMARLGRVFAAMVAGMREILMARASIKGEMRMNRTMISSGGNNPLKFSISPEQAIEAMIRPSVRGYLDAETATNEALSDIRAHEIAMMSGMDAALKDLLARLSPDQLSARIESGATLGNLLGGKKARYWEAYEKLYDQIAKEAEDDFQSTFGRAFARAYEEQLQKL